MFFNGKIWAALCAVLLLGPLGAGCDDSDGVELVLDAGMGPEVPIEVPAGEFNTAAEKEDPPLTCERIAWRAEEQRERYRRGVLEFMQKAFRLFPGGLSAEDLGHPAAERPQASGALLYRAAACTSIEVYQLLNEGERLVLEEDKHEPEHYENPPQRDVFVVLRGSEVFNRDATRVAVSEAIEHSLDLEHSVERVTNVTLLADPVELSSGATALYVRYSRFNSNGGRAIVLVPINAERARVISINPNIEVDFVEEGFEPVSLWPYGREGVRVVGLRRGNRTRVHTFVLTPDAVGQYSQSGDHSWDILEAARDQGLLVEGMRYEQVLFDGARYWDDGSLIVSFLYAVSMRDEEFNQVPMGHLRLSARLPRDRDGAFGEVEFLLAEGEPFFAWEVNTPAFFVEGQSIEGAPASVIRRVHSCETPEGEPIEIENDDDLDRCRFDRDTEERFWWTGDTENDPDVETAFTPFSRHGLIGSPSLAFEQASKFRSWNEDDGHRNWVAMLAREDDMDDLPIAHHVWVREMGIQRWIDRWARLVTAGVEEDPDNERYRFRMSTESVRLIGLGGSDVGDRIQLVAKRRVRHVDAGGRDVGGNLRQQDTIYVIDIQFGERPPQAIAGPEGAAAE